MPPEDALIPMLANMPPFWASTIGLALLALVALAIQMVLRRYILTLIGRLMNRTRGKWDEVFYEQRVFHRAAWAVSLVIIQVGLPFVPHLGADLRGFIERTAAALMVFVIVRVVTSVITSAGVIYEMRPVSRERPIKGFLQAAILLVYILGAIIAVATFLDRSPWVLLSGIGVLASVIMLVFQDTILSFVAGTQLTANRLIRVGDWIEMPEFQANGDVIDITLNSVLVRNFDKTVTAIPAHRFLQNSFKNWRGMQESGGRRMKRSMHIDMNSIRFLTQAEIDYFKRFTLLREYMEGKEAELERFNSEHLPDPGFISNERRLTNVGTFRAYVMNFLRQHPGIHKDMTFLVRQLEPTPQGLPLEIYVFTNTTVWAAYEGIQADVFDHLLAITPEFGLKVYQQPAGSDLRALGQGAPLPGLQDGVQEGEAAQLKA